MKLLFIGDIVGKPGRDLVRRGVRPLIERHSLDLVIANVENAAGGFGVTREVVDEMRGAGVDVMTSGNHIWDKKEVLEFIDTQPRLLRPLNYPEGAPGRGIYVATTATGEDVAVLNAMGRVFLPLTDDPFAALLREIEAVRHRTKVVFVDFHAEATSEKIAMGWHLDGLATAVVGTHTHVQTADERILPKGTAYLTDAGMTGPHDGIIGVEIAPALERFKTALPSRFETAKGNPRLHGVLIEAEVDTGRATSIARLNLSAGDIDRLAADPQADL